MFLLLLAHKISCSKMKALVLIFFLLLANNPNDFTREIDQFTLTLEQQLEELTRMKDHALLDLQSEYLSSKSFSLDSSFSSAYRLECLLRQNELEAKIENTASEFDLKFVEMRYSKGIEIMKMLYEKVLALDHHFTSLNTMQSINGLSNPNSYPEFSKVQDIVEKRSVKKNSVKMPNFLMANPYVSLTTSVISSFFGDGDKRQRSSELNSISCMLDFTVSMYSDLKVIYFETEYLRLNNKELLDACNQLFRDYTKAIDYKRSLTVCRDTDDWDVVDVKIEKVLGEMRKLNASPNYPDRKLFIKEMNNLEFSIDRLLGFIDDYSEFVSGGERYYQKFLSIIRSYKHKELCVEHLPTTYAELEQEIELSIEKFNTAYKIAELQGTKLRDLLYGVPD